MPSEFCITPFFRRIDDWSNNKASTLALPHFVHETTMCGKVLNIWSEFVNAWITAIKSFISDAYRVLYYSIFRRIDDWSRSKDGDKLAHFLYHTLHNETTMCGQVPSILA
jgi:hypothetical protein